MSIWERFFGRSDNISVLITIPRNVYNGLEAMVYVHNSKNHEIDHITVDQIAAYSLSYTIRKHLRIVNEEKRKREEDERRQREEFENKKKRKNATPVYYVDDVPRGRAQASSVIYPQD